MIQWYHTLKLLGIIIEVIYISCLVQECPGDLVYDDCHSDCDFCDSNGAGCTFLCIKGCGCPNELLRLSMDNPFTCVKREDCPGKMQFLRYQVGNKN